MPSQMFPRRCNVDGCEKRIVETIHPGVFFCFAPTHKETPIFEIRSDDEIIYGTGHALVIPVRGPSDGTV